MKHRILFAFTLFILPLALSAQILKPISWNHQFAQQEVAVGQTVELVFKATIEKNWYLYSSDFDPDLGPMVTEFAFEPHPSYELVGGIVPVSPKKKYDSLIWDGEYTYFTGKGEFRQQVKILAENPQIKATANFQVCSDLDGRCIPLEETFQFAGLTVSGAANAPAAQSAAPEKKKESESGESPELAAPAEEGLFGFMLVAFFTGILAIFTPCVFPIIPMTVSFFTNRAGKGPAFFYGFSVVAIYTAVGLVIAPLFGPAFANFISTHWLPNLLFFVVFIVFALSFFGMFDIVLPSSLVNKIDQQADKGGLLGPFFMALTLVVVSFSCTGPLVGSLMVESAGGKLLKPIAGMFAFGLAFGLPFTLFALFPSWLKTLPKSGGWLNSVKVTLGFLELALAFKFLSVADQVYHWGILDREVNIAIWIAISLGMALYFLGYLRLPHDSKVETVSVPRMLLALASISFVVYLLPGMFGAPLKALAGYLPPRTTQDFDLAALTAPNGTAATSRTEGAMPRHAELFKMPYGLQGFFDLAEGIEAAKAAGKPILIDFTGHGCVNCRKMEEFVWSDPAVRSRLQNDYVIVQLYVDDKTELPESEWITSKYDGKVKKTIGAINADYQIVRYQNNAQPYYVLLDHAGNQLAAPFAYDPEPARFAEFLDKGKTAFQSGERLTATAE